MNFNVIWVKFGFDSKYLCTYLILLIHNYISLEMLTSSDLYNGNRMGCQLAGAGLDGKHYVAWGNIWI